jgi:hypothetical protein
MAILVLASNKVSANRPEVMLLRAQNKSSRQ